MPAKSIDRKELVRQWGDAHWNFDPTKDIDHRDPYGHAMGLWFAIADWLYASGARIPPSWNYSPGAGVRNLEWPIERNSDIEIEEALGIELHQRPLLEKTPESELLRLGNILERYTRILDKKGLSY